MNFSTSMPQFESSPSQSWLRQSAVNLKVSYDIQDRVESVYSKTREELQIAFSDWNLCSGSTAVAILNNTLYFLNGPVSTLYSTSVSVVNIGCVAGVLGYFGEKLHDSNGENARQNIITEGLQEQLRQRIIEFNNRLYSK